MSRKTIRPVICLAIAGMAAASPALAQETCTREALRAAVDSYLAAQSSGDRSAVQFGHGYRYLENREPMGIDTGVINTPLAIDYSNAILDEEECEAFAEVVALDPAHPYVLGAAIKVEDALVTELSVLVTDEDDWLFDAQGFHDGVRDEDWSDIPAERRDTRETLIAAATAYYDRFDDPSVVVPFGEECYRVEGGINTAAGPDAPANSCGLGMPADGGMQLVDRRFIADPVKGAVAGFSRFGAENGEPDVHLFRVTDGTIRYVHAMTACSENGCDFGTGAAPGAPD